MAFSEQQLDVWARQGSVPQSQQTYQIIRNALNDPTAPFASRSFEVFLQGSYCNDTNVWSESDVDVVIMLTSTYYHEKEQLNETEKGAYERDHIPASYSYEDFKREVTTWLVRRFGADAVDPGTKAITVRGNGSRRDADVLVAAEYRRYTSYQSGSNQHYYQGIVFWSSKGEKIVNFPKQHSENLTRKHQDTDSWLKPAVRIIKNMRNRMVDQGHIEDGLAPSYYLEGLLYNVPNTQFGYNYTRTFTNLLTWLQQADRSDFVCANELYFLLREGSPVTWRAAKCQKFLDELAAFWTRGAN